ncbi:MAG: hypothetical protein WAQ33_01890 [Gaiellaceae bacterium]
MTFETALIVESYNHAQGSALDRLRLALVAASRIAAACAGVEVLIADSSGDPELPALLGREFPEMRRVDATGLDYDEAKMKAAREARATYVVYLDGDCIPESGWLDAHLGALKGGAAATGGFTRYDRGFLGTVFSVLDFGFLLPAGERVLGCYAFNNTGFRRDVLLEVPLPDGPMRCRCFAHAQKLLRRGTPVRMVPSARVRHERQPFMRERLRQGYDVVAACWVDPDLRECRWLRLGLLAGPLFYARSVVFDWRRLVQGRRDLELGAAQVALALPLFPFLRLADLVGTMRALVPRRDRRARSQLAVG